jgi:hypothetical protein
VQRLNRVASIHLRRSLRPWEIEYVTQKKSERYLQRYYPEEKI